MTTTEKTIDEQIEELKSHREWRDRLSVAARRLAEKEAKRDETKVLVKELDEACKEQLAELRKMISDAKSGQGQLNFEEAPDKANDDRRKHWSECDISELDGLSKQSVTDLRKLEILTVGDANKAANDEPVGKLEGGVTMIPTWSEGKQKKLLKSITTFIEAWEAVDAPPEPEQESEITLTRIKVTGDSNIITQADLQVGGIYDAEIAGLTARVKTEQYGAVDLLDGEWEQV